MPDALGYLITILCTIIVLMVGSLFRKIGNIETTVSGQKVVMATGLTERPTFEDCNKRQKDLKIESCKKVGKLEKDFKRHHHVRNTGEVVLAP